MVDELNKTSPSHRPNGGTQKKRIPVYILMLVGIFLLAILLYMFADMKPNPSDAPPGHPNPNAQPATMNSSTTGAPGDEKRASQ